MKNIFKQNHDFFLSPDFSTQQLADRGSDFSVSDVSSLDLNGKDLMEVSPARMSPDLAFSSSSSVKAGRPGLLFFSVLSILSAATTLLASA